ncbi:MAG: hypothetical protein OEY55_05235 [Acidimicrobiia bacterium]|nr:hypothetical protein [Acidimicrobiia bacterium]MDH5504912.1 hypothetical protein [Acidimicrobiia bacterium]
MTTTEIRPVTDPKPSQQPAIRRFGYLVAIAVNFGLIAVANNILEWDIVPFLTSDFSRLVGFISLSLGLTIAANTIYLVFDPPWFKSLSQIGLFLVSLAVTIRIYQVFPFDFSSFDFDWSVMTRWLLIIAMAGTCIGMLAEAAKLVRAVLRGQQTPA